MEAKTWHKIGAAVMLVAAVVIMLMGKPSSLTPLSATEDIGAIAQYGEDRIQPFLLADWIISETGDFQVVDLRQAADFGEYSIDGSMNLPFTSLMTRDGLYEVPKYQKIVLVCGDGSRSGQAWTVLRSKGYEAYILTGGIKGWMRQIMTPVDAADLDLTDIDPHEFALKLKAMREHFTGTSEELGVSSETTTSAPPPPPPPTSSGGKKKKAGGC
ncbi:MAG: rhodanese-like domain-containing protein [bacterium]